MFIDIFLKANFIKAFSASSRFPGIQVRALPNHDEIEFNKFAI